MFHIGINQSIKLQSQLEINGQTKLAFESTKFNFIFSWILNNQFNLNSYYLISSQFYT